MLLLFVIKDHCFLSEHDYFSRSRDNFGDTGVPIVLKRNKSKKTFLSSFQCMALFLPQIND